MEEEKAEVLTIAFADNTLEGPAECIKYMWSELIKVGHQVVLFTYHIDQEEKMADLKKFISEEVEMPELEVVGHKDVEADVFYDRKNFGGVPGFYELFVSCLQGGVIAPTQPNIKKFEDMTFWETGKVGTGIIMPSTPKIILPGD